MGVLRFTEAPFGAVKRWIKFTGGHVNVWMNGMIVPNVHNSNRMDHRGKTWWSGDQCLRLVEVHEEDFVLICDRQRCVGDTNCTLFSFGSNVGKDDWTSEICFCSPMLLLLFLLLVGTDSTLIVVGRLRPFMDDWLLLMLILFLFLLLAVLVVVVVAVVVVDDARMIRCLGRPSYEGLLANASSTGDEVIWSASVALRNAWSRRLPMMDLKEGNNRLVCMFECNNQQWSLFANKILHLPVNIMNL